MDRTLTCIRSIASFIIDTLVLQTFERYESIAIVPVSFLRRHVPLLGGALVLVMTFTGIFVRVCVEIVHTLIARITYSANPVLNYQIFWCAIRDHYAKPENKGLDWEVVRQIYQDCMHTKTSEEDLWIAMQDSVVMTDDAMLSVTRTSLGFGPSFVYTATGRRVSQQIYRHDEEAICDMMTRSHLFEGGNRIANGQILYGMLRSDICDDACIGYIGLTSMEGFVDLPLPQENSVRRTQKHLKSPVVVPQLYDIETMRWALSAVLSGMQSTDALILDLRLNQGGGNARSALSVASLFHFTSGERCVAFSIEEKVAAGRFNSRKTYRIPRGSHDATYTGPLIILQSQHTRGTAELLCLALQSRPQCFRVGTRTSGHLSQLLTIRLPNAWILKIPNQRCYSADDIAYEDEGIPPDREVTENFTALNKHVDPCIKEAVALIKDNFSPNKITTAPNDKCRLEK